MLNLALRSKKDACGIPLGSEFDPIKLNLGVIQEIPILSVSI